jgi:hypothetical protein
MNRFLSITNLLAVFLFGAQMTVLAQSVQLPVPRQKGASLDISIAQEADHTIRLAREWLRNTPPANTDTQNCALVRLVLENEASATNLMALAATAGLFAKTNQTEAVLVACLAVYPPKPCDPENLWLVSRAINLYRNGLLLRNTEALDWRNDFAQLLICSQRNFPSGGGYWEPSRLDPADLKSTPQSLMIARIRATAFGILALKEIHE